MKKFEFSLSRMRNYKEQLLDGEKNILGQVKHRKNLIDSHIEKLETEFERISREMTAEQEKGITVFKLQEYGMKIGNIRKQLEQLRIDQRVAEKEVARQILVVVAASQEVSKLDKLEERQLEEYQQSVAKADQTILDELISSKLVRENTAARSS